MRFVGEAQALIPARWGAGTQVDTLGQVGETEAAVQALGSRIEGTDLAGVHGGEGDESEIIRELADLEWIAGELCRIAQQAATSDVEGARRAWESEGRFLAGRIETRSTSVLARIDRAKTGPSGPRRLNARPSAQRSGGWRRPSTPPRASGPPGSPSPQRRPGSMEREASGGAAAPWPTASGCARG